MDMTPKRARVGIYADPDKLPVELVRTLAAECFDGLLLYRNPAFFQASQLEDFNLVVIDMGRKTAPEIAGAYRERGVEIVEAQRDEGGAKVQAPPETPAEEPAAPPTAKPKKAAVKKAKA